MPQSDGPDDRMPDQGLSERQYVHDAGDGPGTALLDCRGQPRHATSALRSGLFFQKFNEIKSFRSEWLRQLVDIVTEFFFCGSHSLEGLPYQSFGGITRASS
jgi:hypothetical protein